MATDLGTAELSERSQFSTVRCCAAQSAPKPRFIHSNMLLGCINFGHCRLPCL